MPEFQRGRRLAFDVGRARIGVAVCDPDGILASGVATLPTHDESAVLGAINELMVEYKPVFLYVGKPTNLHNENTASTEEALIFARRLQAQVAIPVIMVDERMSTAAAAAQLRNAGRNAKNSKLIIDQAAAAVILESALSLEKSGKAAGAPIVDLTE